MMTKMKKAAFTLAVVGGVAAASVTDRGTFVMAFAFVFFGGIAAAVVSFGGQRTATDFEAVELGDPDPFIDQDGVHHDSPQVLQKNKPPLPGAPE